MTRANYCENDRASFNSPESSMPTRTCRQEHVLLFPFGLSAGNFKTSSLAQISIGITISPHLTIK